MKPAFIKIVTILCVFSFVSIDCLVAADDQFCLFQNCNCTYNETIGYEVICDNLQAQTSGDFPARNPNSNIANITRLSFSNYQFQEIPDGVFEDLIIRELEFNNNGLQTFGARAFQKVVSVTSLGIHEPNFRDFTTGALSPIYFTLATLDLSRSALTNDKFNKLNQELKNIPKLLTLIARGNKLTTVNKILLTGRSTVVKLDFSFNQITQIEDSVFGDLGFLTDLFLAGNLLTSFNASAYGAKMLKQLDLNNNLIENVDLQGSPNLVGLVLANNRVKKILNGTFAGLSKLNLVNLGSNLIDSFEPKAFSPLDDLGFLFLDNNSIGRLPYFSTLVKLYVMTLDNQKSNLKRIEDFAFERTVASNPLGLSISGNDIESYGNRAFCTRGSNYTEIIRLQLSYVSMKNMHKCILKQLRPEWFTTVIQIDQPASSTNVSEVCTCDLYAFAKNELLNITGACDAIFSGPTCANATFVDPCVGLDQFKCPPPNPVTTPVPTTTTIRPITTNSAKKPVQSTATVYYTFVLTTLLFI